MVYFKFVVFILLKLMSLLFTPEHNHKSLCAAIYPLIQLFNLLVFFAFPRQSHI